MTRGAAGRPTARCARREGLHPAGIVTIARTPEGEVPYTRSGARRPVWSAGLLVAALVAGCGVLRPVTLEVPPGHRVVVGRVDLRGLDPPEGILELGREDGTFDHALAVGPGVTEFAMVLPPGRYRVARLRLIEERPGFPLHPVRELGRVQFVVGAAAAIYIGTLRFDAGFGPAVRPSVTDEYDDTLRILRARHPELPERVVRALATLG